jgi:hypothetical protein
VWPEEFNLDYMTHDEYRNPKINDFNVKKRAESFKARILSDFKPYYKTNHLAVLMGDDFAYFNAEVNFGQIDILIEEFNK